MLKGQLWLAVESEFKLVSCKGHAADVTHRTHGHEYTGKRVVSDGEESRMHDIPSTD